MSISVCLDYVIDPAAVLDRIGCIVHDHVRCLTRGVDMDIPEAKYRLENPCCMCIHFLYSVEGALCDASGQSGDLVDPDDPRVCDDEDIELVVDPVEEDKREEYDPVECESSPVECASDDVDHGALVGEYHP